MKKSEALNILGLSDGATDDAVKQAHRKLVIEHHPDKFALGSKEREEAESAAGHEAEFPVLTQHTE